MDQQLREDFQEFSTSVEKNLEKKGVPSKLFGQDLINLLLEFAVEFLQGCLQKKSSLRIANEMRSLSPIQAFILKRRAARKIYRGQASYRMNHGDETIEALLDTCKEYPAEKLKDIVDYVDINDVPEVNPDPIPVDLPSL